MAQQYDTFEAAPDVVDPNHCKHTMQHLESKVKKQQRELPSYWFLNATLVPVFINMLVNYIRSADIHYRESSLSYIMCMLILLMILVSWGVPLYNSPTGKKGRLYTFILLSCIAAWFSGMILGDFNYQRYFKNYFDYVDLEHYPNTDPSLYHGQQFLDAGTIEFSRGSHLDLKGGFGFRNVETYCVAPIVSPLEKLGGFKNFDFWAVGKNCCSGHVADFQCGEYSNPSKWMSGLRMLSAKDRNYYRLAVEGACAANSITAHYPVFFHWVQHPEDEINMMVERGWSYYARETVSFVIFQFCTLVLSLIIFI